MTYVLILFIAVSSGSQMTTVEFNTKDACELAGLKMANELRPPHATTMYVCAPKGVRP